MMVISVYFYIVMFGKYLSKCLELKTEKKTELQKESTLRISSVR